jgi:hypothetical protein
LYYFNPLPIKKPFIALEIEIRTLPGTRFLDETPERGFIITAYVGVLAEKEVIPEVREILIEL